MNEFMLHQELWLSRQRDEIFPFFADAKNLETVTLPWLGLRILTPAPIVMQRGTLIDYALRLCGLPLRWQSEITVWDAPHRFVDEQRRGPYHRWIHEHRFEEHNGGTLCVDHVRYAVLGGRLVEWLFIRRDLERIFAYRRNKLLELFAESRQPEFCSKQRSPYFSASKESKSSGCVNIATPPSGERGH